MKLTITDSNGCELWLEEPGSYAPEGAVARIIVGEGMPTPEAGIIYLDEAGVDALIRCLQRTLTFAPEELSNLVTKIHYGDRP